ncbi:hypothetical protein, partial [Pseudomonas syringae group genomosp. 7]|uniref:hypothetical protein n=1 Tax=Pseudomonas syringae group genomosp. 7 TaxID=251699 RepID=UPI00377038DE
FLVVWFFFLVCLLGVCVFFLVVVFFGVFLVVVELFVWGCLVCCVWCGGWWGGCWCGVGWVCLVWGWCGGWGLLWFWGGLGWGLLWVLGCGLW